MTITKESSSELMKQVRDREGWSDPHRFAFGVARKDGQGNLLDFRPVVDSLDSNYGTAALAAYVMELDSFVTGSYEMSLDELHRMLELLDPWVGDGDPHPNIDGLMQLVQQVALAETMTKGQSMRPSFYSDVAALVVCLGDDAALSIQDAPQAIFALTLLSRRDVRPHEINLEGIFGKLYNLAWTNYGPVQLDDVDRARMSLPGFVVTHVDKFPRMVDYVIPSGVRIADADRVRLGAYLAEGTTVMHEGFVNFNAGTLGTCMVEGRISAGVVVGHGTDVGGGASIMGTLSGGGKEVIEIGERSLLGANSGLGISLGDDCIVEAGLYLTAGSKVTMVGTTDDGGNPVVIKARELSGANGMLFRRNSTSGAIEAVMREGVGIELNESLHAN